MEAVQVVPDLNDAQEKIKAIGADFFRTEDYDLARDCTEILDHIAALKRKMTERFGENYCYSKA